MPSLFKKKKKSKKEKANIAQSLLPSAVFAAVPSSSPPKQPSASSSPTNLRRPISLPVINTATQVEFSPKPPQLRAGQSLLDYPTNFLQETDQGYSTVRDAIIHTRSSRRRGERERRRTRDQTTPNLRPLPAIPRDEEGEEEEVPMAAAASVHYSAVRGPHSPGGGDSSLTSLTPNESETESGSDIWLKDDTRRAGGEEQGLLEAQLSSVYATVVKRPKKTSKSKKDETLPSLNQEGPEAGHQRRDNSEKSSAAEGKQPQQQLPVHEVITCEVENRLEGGAPKKNKSVKLNVDPSTFFELSDSENSASDESLLRDFIPDGGKTPEPSSPISYSASFPTHRPPPSPSPGHSRSSHKSGSGEKTLSSEHKRHSSTQGKKKKASSTPQRQLGKGMGTHGTLLADLPVYNLNQSFTDSFVLSRTDPDGRVEYFTATPITPPTPPVPTLPNHLISPTSSLQLSSFTKEHSTPGATSTPMKPVHQSPVFAQVQVPVLPQSPIPVLPQNLIPAPQTAPFPVLSQQSSASPQTCNDHSVLNHEASLNRSHSASQPSLSAQYIGGLTEIDQVLSNHEASTDKHKAHQTSLQTLKTGSPGVPNESIDHPDHSTEKEEESMKSGRTAHERSELESLEKENMALRETIRHLGQHMASIAPLTITDSIGGCGASVTVEELITETPLKLKRVLNKLMVENGQKDKEIQKLQVDLSSTVKEREELLVKNRALNETHRDTMESAAAERQMLNESFVQASKHSQELEARLKTMKQTTRTLKKDHEKRVNNLKEEIRTLRAEIAHFKKNVQVMNHHHFDLHGAVSKYSSEPHITIDEHKQVVEGLERMLEQMVQTSSTGTLQQNIEVQRLKKESHVLSCELSELKGSVSILKEEGKVLQRQKTEHEEIVSQLKADLKYSQARELQALECLNESLKETEKSKIEKEMLSRKNELFAEERDRSLLKTTLREAELQEMIRKMEDYKTKSKMERKQTLEKFHSQDKQRHHLQKKTNDRIYNLQSQLQEKERELEEASRRKRIAERQLDLLWESRTAKH